MALTDYEEGRILKYLFGQVPFTPPPVYYVGLSSTPVLENGTGASEPSGGNYSRVAVANLTTSFTYSSNQITNAGTAVIFPTASASWGQQNYVAFFDQATGGTVNISGSLSPSQTIDVNQRLQFSAGDMVISMD